MGDPLSLTIFGAVLDNFVETALGKTSRGTVLVWAARVVLAVPALMFAARVQRFHSDWLTLGPALASKELLRFLYGQPKRQGELPKPGKATLVLGNHPGLGDTLIFLSELGHDHVRLVAKFNSFLTALPNLRNHLILVDGPGGRNSGALASIMAALKEGYTVLLYPAGTIEPDPAWTNQDESGLLSWSASSGVLVRSAHRMGFEFDLQCLVVSGVYPRRPKGRGRWDNLSVVLGLSSRHWSPLLKVGAPLGLGLEGEDSQAINRRILEQMHELLGERSPSLKK